MKKFHFRLATLMRVREATRDECRAQLAEALRVQAALDDQAQELERTMREARESHRTPRGQVNVDRLMDAERYEIMLLVERKKLEAQQENVSKEVEKRRQALIWADQDVRVLERLRESETVQWRQSAERETMQQLDELAGRNRPQEVFP
jgi:flagellar export protein FliJ